MNKEKEIYELLPSEPVDVAAMGCIWKFESFLFSSIFKEYGQVVKTLLGTE